MPTSARKSSIGRDLQGNLRPYRGQNPTTGRRTGIVVHDVQRADDGFEPFTKIMSQADLRTPPKVKGRKKKQQKQPSPVDEDEEEELDDNNRTQDMELESPVKYFASTSPRAASSVKRTVISSRSVRKSADVDFDEVPSPSANKSRRKSTVNGTHAGPSRLSNSYVTAEDGDEASEDDEPVTPSRRTNGGGNTSFVALGQDDDDDEMQDAFEENGQLLPDSPGYDAPEDRPVRQQPPVSGRNKGKGRAQPVPELEPEAPGMDMEVDDDEQQESNPPSPAESRNRKSGDAADPDEEEDEDASATQRAQRDKGKGRAPGPVEDDDVDLEGDIANGLQDVNLQGDSDEEQEERPRKKTKKEPVKRKKPTPRTQQDENEWEFGEDSELHIKLDNGPDEGSYNSPSGVRRSRRYRYKPLDWWRLEKVVYGKSENGRPAFVPNITEICRKKKEEPQPLGKRKRSKTSRARSVQKERETATAEPVVVNPEEGWDDDTEMSAMILDFETKQEIPKKIAVPAKKLQLRQALNADWHFQKVFGDQEFIAAGRLTIPPGARKPSKPTKDNTYIFYVIEGAVNLKIHKSSHVLATGATFMVPRGNTYFIENIADRDAKLFFTQARNAGPSANEDTDRNTSVAAGRSSEAPADNETPAPASTSRATTAAPGTNRAESRARTAKRATSVRT